MTEEKGNKSDNKSSKTQEKEPPKSDDEVVKKTKQDPKESKTESKGKPSKEAKKKGKKKAKPELTRGRAYVQSSYNNTLVTITDLNGNVVAWESAGAIGFKGAKKSTPYAATIVVKSLMEKIIPTGLKTVDVFVKGIGSGREAAVRALGNEGLEVNTIKDMTPIPHNGCRPKKVRRV